MQMPRNEFSPAFFAAMAIISAFVIILIGGSAAYLVTQHEIAVNKQQQVQQSQVLEAKLCRTLDNLAALPKPPGTTNQAVTQWRDDLADTLSQLAPDVGCPK
jgi:hypothetical protein